MFQLLSSDHNVCTAQGTLLATEAECPISISNTVLEVLWPLFDFSGAK